jgi:TPR repeat protein
MKLADYFSKDPGEFLKLTPAIGEPTDWLDFCELELKGTNILIVDAHLVPSKEDGLLVALTPGKYVVQGKAINYSGDRRAARLRVFQKATSPELGAKIGKTWTDTATTGICDFETFSTAWGNDSAASYQILAPFFESEDDIGVAVFDASFGAVMPVVHSGFGDGKFPVFELLKDDHRVGFEIEFIAEGKAYPFGVTPYQKQIQISELEQRAEQGDVETQFKLARMYQTGDGIGKNSEKAAQWFASAFKNGHVEATRILGALYKNGNGVVKDYVRAKELFELAAGLGSASALNELGVLYRNGEGVAVNYEKAVEYYQQAAAKGSAPAQYNLGVHYSRGYGVEQNYEAAAKWYRLAVDQGNLNAIFNLGNLYQRGEVGVAKDEKEAVKLFGAGAMADHAGCANNLGHCYELGLGVEKNLEKAFIWYSMAAIKDVAIAQKSIGVLNRKGEGGVKKNLAAAIKWLGKAAKNGDAEAHYELGLMYEAGEGVAVNKIEACQLYQKAITGGFVEAKAQLDKLALTLTEAERATLVESSQNE